MPPSRTTSRPRKCGQGSARRRSSRPGAAGTSRKGSGAGSKPRFKKWITIAALLLGGAMVGLSIFVGILDAYGQKNRARRADAIVVLGARVREDGKAGQGLQMRVMHAVRLYHKGFAPKLIMTGGVGDNPPAEAEVAARLAVERGVPRNDILLENKSTSTWQNTAFASEICKQHGWKNVVLVSDPFHLWRAERNFRKHGISAHPSPVAVKMWQEQPVRKAFWTAREAILISRDWVLRRV